MGIVTVARAVKLRGRVLLDSAISGLAIIGRRVETVFVQVLFIGLFVEMDTLPRLYGAFTPALPAIALATHGRGLATGGGPSHPPVPENSFDFIQPARDATSRAGPRVVS